MKKIFCTLICSLAFAGCSSFTDIGHVVSAAKTDDGKTPIANVVVQNVSYKLFGVLPIESGTTWKQGPYAKRHTWNWTFFRNTCTVDENLASLKAALREIGSNKVDNLVTDTDCWSLWSLFLVRREVIKTTCTVLK